MLLNSSLLYIAFHKSSTFTVTWCRTSELILEKIIENTPEKYPFIMARIYVCALPV